MNTEYFIARKIIRGKERRFSKPIVQISIASIALGLAVMLIAVSVLSGFQNQIKNKVIGFAGHIHITNYDFNTSYEYTPISKEQDFLVSLQDHPEIKSIQVFARKAGIIKADDQIMGVVLKGVDEGYDWQFFKDKLMVGELPAISNTERSDQVIVSSYIADKMLLSVGDDLRMYFISSEQSTARGRKFMISGIYETGLEEFDKRFIVGDIGHIQKLNRWEDDQVSGFEVLLLDFDKLDVVHQQIYEEIGYDLDASKITYLYPQIFDWLNLQDMNVLIILVLMVVVAGITMVSTILILIIERTNMIGILKALGSKDSFVRRVFIYQLLYIILRGLFWGNVVGIGFILVQYYFQPIGLDQEIYYIAKVPVAINAVHFILINLYTLLICTLFLILPSYVITRITPLKAIRYN